MCPSSPLGDSGFACARSGARQRKEDRHDDPCYPPGSGGQRSASPAPAGLVSPGLTAHKWLALGILALAQLMVELDTTIVNVTLPSIQTALRFTTDASLQWVVNAYVLAFGGFLLLGGRVADRYGRRLVFVAGVVLFVASSLAGGLAGSAGMLVAARAAQGLGAAFMTPAALSPVTLIFAEGQERDRALGIWGAIAGAGPAIGLLVGGVLTSELSRRWVLFVNVPIGVIAFLNASQQVGGSLGLAILTMVASAGFTRPAHPTSATLAAATTNSWAVAFAVSAGLLLAAAVACGVLVRVDPAVPPPPTASASE